MKYGLLALMMFSLLFGCGPHSENPDTGEESHVGGFTQLPASETGVDFVNHVEENFTNFFARFQYVYNGGGVAIGDVDGDGLSDLFFTANEGANKLYRNKGDLRFEDVTSAAGLGQPGGWKSGTVMADVNGDGHLDIYVCRGGSRDNSPEELRRNLLYLNDGSGSFREAAAELGLDDPGYSLHAVFFDIDNDNDLDAYVTNRPDTFFIPFTEVLQAKKRQDPEFSDQLYRNDDGRFVRVTEEAGITGNFGYGLGLVTLDVNGDGFQDILVSNDYLESDYLYVNQGDGTFREAIREWTNHTAFYGMGVDAVDVNNDGLEDILQLDMSPEDYVRSKTTMASMNVEMYRLIMSSGFHDQYMHNMLQLNREGHFSEISQFAGVQKTDWSWACLGADFDNDGRNEIFITNGYRRDVADKDGNKKFREYLRSEEMQQRTDEENADYVIGLFRSVPLGNYLFDSRAGTLHYENVASGWGLAEPSFSNGAAYGDLDNDGDLDLVVNNLEREAFVYRNETSRVQFLQVQLAGPRGNAYGVGAKVTLKNGNQIKRQTLKTVRGYLSSVEPICHFGLGDWTTVDEVLVEWPDGTVHRVEQPDLNRKLTVNYGDPAAQPERPEPTDPVFVDASSWLGGNPPVYRENEFDDYRSQVLLPHGHSRQGPALAVGDVNGDGLADFFMGGAKRTAGELYLQEANGEFRPRPVSAFATDAGHEDTDAAFFDADGDGDLDLYVVSGGSEFPIGTKMFQDRLYTNDGAGTFSRSHQLPEINSSGGCVLPMDFDDDGDLDLFVGGRIVPTLYPAAPRSYLLENREGSYFDVTRKLAPALSEIGMVTTATFVDLDGDDREELVLAGEWMPLSVFRGGADGYTEATEEFDLGQTHGWWNKLVAADVDGDGDQDLLAGNLGLNYKFRADPEKPFYVYAKDFDANGSNDIFLAKETENRLVPIRGRECSSQQMPGIADQFPSYEDFAQADLPDIIDVEAEDAVRLEAYEFASVWAENRGGRFVLHPLPDAVQFSVVNGILLDDFTGDGMTDILTAGNKFDVEIETTRADAGLGTLVTGSAPSELTAIKPRKAGLYLHQDTRGIYPIALADGRKGILVAVNGGALRLLTYGGSKIGK